MDDARDGGLVTFDNGVSTAVHGYETTVSAEQLRRLARVASTRTRKVAILGFGKTVRDCPWTDDSWELWAMNGFWRAAKPDFGVEAAPDRYALWLDMHSLEFTREYGKAAGFGDAQNEWLKQRHPFPILALDDFGPEYPSVRRYPIESIIADFNRDYFTSTVAYAIALAASMPDVAEIGLWGIDLIHDTEYGDQRPCCEYWLGRAEERGIKITRHEDSAVLRQRYRYGYEQESDLLKNLRAALIVRGDKINAAILKRRDELDHVIGQQHTDEGALQIIRETIQRLDSYSRGGRVE